MWGLFIPPDCAISKIPTQTPFEPSKRSPQRLDSVQHRPDQAKGSDMAWSFIPFYTSPNLLPLSNIAWFKLYFLPRNCGHSDTKNFRHVFQYGWPCLSLPCARSLSNLRPFRKYSHFGEYLSDNGYLIIILFDQRDVEKSFCLCYTNTDGARMKLQDSGMQRIWCSLCQVVLGFLSIHYGYVTLAHFLWVLRHLAEGKTVANRRCNEKP